MGSGKSAAARLLAADTDALLIDADLEAKMFMARSGRIRQELVEAFGPRVAEKDEIDFKELGRVAFNSRENLETLNRIVHPSFLSHLRRRVEQDNDVILDAALVTLWGIEKWFTGRLWIHASHEVRLRRLMAGSAGSAGEAAVQERMRLQESMVPEPHDASWRRVANDGTIEELAAALAAIRLKQTAGNIDNREPKT
jgi:dephospho-CoA kinase